MPSRGSIPLVAYKLRIAHGLVLTGLGEVNSVLAGETQIVPAISERYGLHYFEFLNESLVPNPSHGGITLQRPSE
jgi:hypothetical protein